LQRSYKLHTQRHNTHIYQHRYLFCFSLRHNISQGQTYEDVTKLYW